MSSRKPTVTIDTSHRTQTEKPIQHDLPFKDQKDTSTSRPQTIKTDTQQPPISTRPELKWPTRIDAKKPSKTDSTTIVDGYNKQPLEPVYMDPEGRQPITTPESTRVDVTKPSRITDISRPQTQPKYPVSIRPDITRPETYTRAPIDSTSQSVSTSSTVSRWKDKIPTQTSRPTTSRPATHKPTDSSRPQNQQDFTTRQPGTSSSADKKQQPQQTTGRPANTFTEVKPDQYHKVDTEIRQPDKDKSRLPPVLDHSRPEYKEPHDSDYPTYSRPSSSLPTSTSSRPSVPTTSSRQPVISKPATSRPSPDKDRPDIRKPTTIDAITSRPPTNVKQDYKQSSDRTKQPTYTDYTTLRPEIRKTTQPDQSRITEVKHASMQDFTSRPSIVKTQTSSTDYGRQPTTQTQPAIVKTQTSSTDYGRQPTSPPPQYKRPIETSTSVSTSQKDGGIQKPTISSTGERCTDSYCVPYFDEGMLQGKFLELFGQKSFMITNCILTLSK